MATRKVAAVFGCSGFLGRYVTTRRATPRMDAQAFLAQDHAIMDAVNDIVRDLGGSFSAEHGVGLLKPYMMEAWRGGPELAAMRAIKSALDPHGIMNPGKLLP